ncbi:MAG: DNA repair protein RecO [Chloroflexota bacterium]|nr:DNA repair protein RecO [Chloroflexota bacterium]
MPPPRMYRAEALVLKNMPLGEADLLVTLFSREAGKLRAIAKGARRSNAKLVGHLEPLTLTRLSLSRGHTLDVISQAETLENFTPLKSSLTAIARGMQVSELVDGFGSEASANEPLYDLAWSTLESIGKTPEYELPLFHFQLHLLGVSGLMPELSNCVECRRDIEPDRHRYSIDGGGVFCPDCTPDRAGLRPLSLRALKVMRLLARSDARALPTLNLDAALTQELRAVLSGTVQYWLDREIRTNSFMNQLARTERVGRN